MSYSGGWRPHIESALCLSVDRLLKTGCITPGNSRSGTLRWTRTDHWGGSAEEIASAGYSAQLGDDSGTLTLHYTCTGRDGERKAITCTIPLVTLARHYGGRRWYMQCPYTGRRALKLYKWSGIDWYCRRDAITPRPTYASQRVSGSDHRATLGTAPQAGRRLQRPFRRTLQTQMDALAHVQPLRRA